MESDARLAIKELEANGKSIEVRKSKEGERGRPIERCYVPEVLKVHVNETNKKIFFRIFFSGSEKLKRKKCDFFK